MGEQGRVREVMGRNSSVWGGVESHRDRCNSYKRPWGGWVQRCSGPPPSCPVVNCSITWAVFIADDYNLLMLVEIEAPTTRNYFQVVSYDLGNWDAVGAEWEGAGL